MAEGYAMIAGAMSMDGFLLFSGVTISDGGYIRIEKERLMRDRR
jgi:hypothetical protein